MHIAALDIGGTKTIVAVIDETGQIIEKQVFPTVAADCYAHLDQCVQILLDLLGQIGISVSALQGVGVSLPGIVDSKEGVLIYAPYAKWEQVPIAAYLSNKLGTAKVFCENDVNACAIGENLFGLGKKYTDYIWMTVSTGVGGAVVADSKLVKGAYGFAGELGHLKVEYTSPARCSCGQYGCMEAQASGTALNRAIQKEISDNPVFAEAFSAARVNPDGAGCEKLARAGNKDAMRIFEQIGMYLGRGIAYCANILNVQAVVIGGGVSASLDLMLPGIQAAIKIHAFEKMQNFAVTQTMLGYEAALLGAAALVIQAQKQFL